MAKTKLNVPVKVKKKEETNLSNTLISVLTLGAFILIVWASVYFLFLDRL